MLPSPPGARTSRAYVLVLALITLAFLAQAVYLARVLAPSHDETSALFFGSLAAEGRIGLYQDDMVGHRPPGPYYVLGVSQALWGRNLMAARLLSVAFGLGLVLLTAELGRRLAGPRAGLLAAALLTAQGAVVGYYATAHYHAIVGLTLVAGLLIWAATPARNVAGAGVLGLLFFLRTHMWPLLPLVFLLALRRARGTGGRLLVAAVMLLPPLGFFLWNPHHLKILSLVPLVGRFVRPLGYLPFTYLDERPQQGSEYQAWALTHLARRYEFLVLATVLILGLVAWRLWRGADRSRYLGNARLNLIAGLFVYMMASLLVVFRINFKWTGFYFASLAPLLVVVLAGLADRVFGDPGLGRRARAGLAIALAALLALPVWFNRSPLMPIGSMAAKDPFAAGRRAGGHLARLVPREADVFFFGQADVFFFSGLPPTHLQQIANYNTLAARDDDNRATMRSGYYGLPQVERWLGDEADYAVISPESLDAVVAESGAPAAMAPKIERIRNLLAERFSRVGVVDEFPYYSYVVYRRVSASGPARSSRSSGS